MHKPLLFLLSAGCLISCNKEASNPVNKWTWFGTQNSAVYNYVLINGNQVLNKTTEQEFHVGVSAAFIDSNNHQVSVVRTLSINNLVIEPGQDSTYIYNYSPGDTTPGSTLFGTRVLINIHGSDEADTVSSSIYLPKRLTDRQTSYPDSISNGLGMELRWSPDEQNTWGQVQIQLFYYNALSRKYDQSLPLQISTVNLTVADNGSYDLTPADLKTFPLNAYIGITIARGTQTEALLPLSRKRVYYFTSSSFSTQPVKIVD